MYRLSKRSYERLNGVNAILIGILTEAIKESPHDFGVPEDGGLRTDERQKELYNIGRVGDMSNNVVTYCDGVDKKSRHQFAEAFDIFGYKEGKASWNEDVLSEIANHIVSVANVNFGVVLTWGGDWKNKDMPHFQL